MVNVTVVNKSLQRVFLLPRHFQQNSVLGVLSANQSAALAAFRSYRDKYHLKQLVGALCVNPKNKAARVGTENSFTSLITTGIGGTRNDC